ncbi:four-helix bundle copper-binding protein [Bacillus thermotolerans]|uniref:four-helix bundle copper-binding protein n=1 Tax=Bacillus thermotolerans TaxID=1221996 RepID=UPI00057EB274|nr:four-helix bundle copper-binding protein [Bacillus thermotolerans]
MYDNMPHPGIQSQPSYEETVEAVQHCEATCESVEFFVMQMKDIRCRGEQLRLLRDCADICALTAKCMARCSGFAKTLALVCAEVCEVCGHHCLHHSDDVSQRCAQICLHCARECQAFAVGA